MERKSKLARQEGLIIYCPFCGASSHVLNRIKWCNNCYTEWYKTKSGNYRFDPDRHTPGYQLAIAVCKAGGIAFSCSEASEKHPLHQQEL